MLWIQLPAELLGVHIQATAAAQAGEKEEREVQGNGQRSNEKRSSSRSRTASGKSRCRDTDEIPGLCHSQDSAVLLLFQGGVLLLNKKRGDVDAHRPPSSHPTNGPHVLPGQESNPASSTRFPMSLSLQQEDQVRSTGHKSFACARGWAVAMDHPSRV